MHRWYLILKLLSQNGFIEGTVWNLEALNVVLINLFIQYVKISLTISHLKLSLKCRVFVPAADVHVIVFGTVTYCIMKLFTQLVNPVKPRGT